MRRLSPDPVRLALIVAGVLALTPGAPSVAGWVLLIAVPILLAVSRRRSVRVAAVLLLLGGAIGLRIALTDNAGSDVLPVTTAAIHRALDGLNPYGFQYSDSTPPGSPFPYGPVALLWYLPLWQHPELIEMGAAIVVSIILALEGRLLGLAVYATAPVVLASAVDGSNDTSLGLMLLGAFLLAGRWPSIGAGVLGLAVAFKLSALAFVPVFLAWAGWRAAGSFLTISLIAWAPVIWPWQVQTFVRSLELAEDTHRNPYSSLGAVIHGLTNGPVDILEPFRLVAGGLTAVATLRLRRSLDGVVIAGAIVYLVTLFTGVWASYAYIAALAPVVCWRLDAWLGFTSQPFAWPPRLLPSALRT